MSLAEREDMKLIVFLLIITAMYLVGYISGFRECENITQKVLNNIIEEQMEKDDYKVSRYEEKVSECS